VPAVTGTYDLYEVNGFDGYLKEMVVWARHDGTNYQFSHHHSSFWAKLTGESSGSYSWTEMQTNGSTATTRTGTTNAEEVSGRLGIPDNSIVRMFQGRGPANYRFEYHGANQGTEKALSYADSSTAYTDSWDREVQSTNRGVNDQFVSRLYVDSATGELKEFTRRPSYDANGHRETVSTETRRTLGVFTPSTETYEFVDCDTGLTTVARFGVADLPSDDYCYIWDGSCYVGSYNDGISAGAATSPVPDYVLNPTGATECADLTQIPASDDFGGTWPNSGVVDDEAWTLRVYTHNKYGTGAEADPTISSGKVLFSLSSGQGIYTDVVGVSSLASGSMEIDISATAYTDEVQFNPAVKVGATYYGGGILYDGSLNHLATKGGTTQWTSSGGSSVTVKFVWDGVDVSIYIGGVLRFTEANAGACTEFISFQVDNRGGSGTATASFDNLVLLDGSGDPVYVTC
jgi:hypothetical protein